MPGAISVLVPGLIVPAVRAGPAMLACLRATTRPAGRLAISPRRHRHHRLDDAALRDDRRVVRWTSRAARSPTGSGAARRSRNPGPGSDFELLLRVLSIGLLVASVLIVVGLLAGRQWAWVLAIISSGLILAIDLGWWWSGDATLRVDAHQLRRGLLPEPARRPGRPGWPQGRDMTGPSDLDLLRRHEPILRFTDGELFFPMAAGSYVEACDLLTGPSLREARVAIPAGELNLERLAAVGDPPLGEAQFLRFVPKPLSALELRRWQSRPEHQRFSAPGRLARVGLAARLVDAGLVTSLLLRGRVPGGTAAAASERYDEIRARDPQRRLPRPGRARGPLGRPALHVLLRDERLAIHVRGCQRSRGRPGAMLRRPRGPRRRHAACPPGSAPPPMTRRAMTCADAGTTHGWRSSTAIRSSTRAPDRTRPTSSAASTSCCCRSPARRTSADRSISCGGSGATRSPSRTRATWRHGRGER